MAAEPRELRADWLWTGRQRIRFVTGQQEQSWGGLCYSLGRMEPETPRRRGRPAGPPGNPLGRHLRETREARGWTVREMAVAVGLPSTSASYISQLEAGLKVPSVELAESLEKLFGDGREIFRLWAMTGRRSDLSNAARARRQLARIFGDPSLAHDPHFTHPAMARIEAARESLMLRRHMLSDFERRRSVSASAGDIALRAQLDRAAAGPAGPDVRAMSPMAAYSRARTAPDASSVRVPVLPEGMDPDHLERMAGRPARWNPGEDFLRLDAEAVRALRLERPFAWRLSAEGVRRVSALFEPGDLAVVTREQGPIVPHEVYAVRHGDRVVLALVMWNEPELLLLPDAGASDFVVLHVGPERALPKHVVGHVATVVRGLERRPE